MTTHFESPEEAANTLEEASWDAEAWDEELQKQHRASVEAMETLYTAMAERGLLNEIDIQYHPVLMTLDIQITPYALAELLGINDEKS